jgi:hypothetical protein
MLKAAIVAHIDASKAAGKPFVWTKTADEKITRFALRTVQTHGAK